MASLGEVEWICLQRGPGGNALVRPFAMTESGEGPLQETAALIETLDAVVTTDTAVAHLAGALNKTTFVMLHRADSPWYPSLRLFRQAEPGNWPPVVAAVAEALQARV